jgi:hypothetical protein
MRPRGSPTIRTTNCRPHALALIGGALSLIVVAALVDARLPKRNKATATTSSDSEWADARGRLWTGVKLYHGPARMYVGDALGGNNNYRDPLTGEKMRAVKVRMESGSEEWKSRNAIVVGPWYVRRDDPALAPREWYEYKW